MQDKKNYSDRRRNRRRDPAFEISLPYQNKRHGARRCNPRRCYVRLNRSFEISLPNQDGMTINVSASGVYFDVITNDIEAFTPGTIIPIQITATTTTPGVEERKIKLKGEGCIVRNNIEDVTRHGNRVGVALKFTDKLNIVVESD
jgi:hypothetical protein